MTLINITPWSIGVIVGGVFLIILPFFTRRFSEFLGKVISISTVNRTIVFGVSTYITYSIASTVMGFYLITEEVNLYLDFIPPSADRAKVYAIPVFIIVLLNIWDIVFRVSDESATKDNGKKNGNGKDHIADLNDKKEKESRELDKQNDDNHKLQGNSDKTSNMIIKEGPRDTRTD